jgi:tetratricopeptide (TPR) repeat protein
MAAAMLRYCWSILALAAALAATGPARAQELPAPPQLVIAVPVEKPVVLESVRINTDIRGSLAVTSVEMRFFNPNARQLEGELQFPLLDGQRVVGMAMDVDGKLRDGVPVEKARGQAIFEEITRAQIDPALLQVTQGNNYKLRVYPILAGKYKTVVIRYAESLAVRQGQYHFRLPLAYAERLAAFELGITVTDPAVKPLQQPAALGEFRFERSGRFYAARIAREQFFVRGMLELAVPAAERPQAYTQSRDGKTYFYAEIPVEAAPVARRLPRVVGIIWDSSGSGAQRDHARELDLLGRYFQQAGNVEVRLVRLRDRADPVERHVVKNGDWRELRKALEATVYDGATHFGAFSHAAQGRGVEEHLLFSDGLANYGGRSFAATPVPLYAISAALKADVATLRRISERSGGRHIDLLAATPADAAKRLLSSSERLLSLTAQGASQLVSASPFPEGGVIRIAGVLDAPAAGIELGVGHAGQAPRTIRLDVGAAALESQHAAWMWASLRVAELEGEYSLNRAEILRLGKAHSLVTRETSLIVLDRVEDYVRFEIAPPAELTADYERQLAAVRQKRGSERQSQLERVVKLFLDKQAWWSREFPKDDRPAAIAKDADDARRKDGAAAKAMARPAPSSPARAGAPGSGLAAEMSADRNNRRDAGKGSAAPAIGIQLRRWTSNAPYIARFAKAAPGDLYRIYLDERASYPGSTAFFLDAADLLLEKGQVEFGLRVLSNLAEMDLENRQVLRILGYRLLQAGQPRLAIPVFEEVLALSPEEPQSYRDLGLAYAADKQYQMAVDSLNDVVLRPWHGRFPEVELIALAEMNAIVAQAQRAGAKLDLARVDPRLLKNLPLDLRVILTWDADNTDIDLWVTDPNGEKAYYGHRLTYQGGRMSPDFTGGYGPEEFSLRSAKPGKYLVHVNFYGHQRQTVAGATTLQVKFITGFGTPRQQEKIVTLRLRERAETFLVGEFEVAPGR